jgi:hypothetical protein
MSLAALNSPISWSDINIELGRSPTSQLNLDDAELKTVAQMPAGESTLDLTKLASKSRIRIVVSTNTSCMNLMSQCISLGYSPGKSYITLNVASGVILGSNTSGTEALLINNFSTGDKLVITNNGYIVGKGGDGAQGSTYRSWMSGLNGQTGGNAIVFGNYFGFANSAVSIINNGTISGGGGGGAAGYGGYTTYTFVGTYYASGGNGGGGAGYPAGNGISTSAITLSGGNYTLPSSASGTLTLGGSGGERVLGLASSSAAANGNQGGNLGQVGYGYSTYPYNAFPGSPGQYGQLVGVGGNPGWGILWPVPEAFSNTSITNTGTIKGAGTFVGYPIVYISN